MVVIYLLAAILLNTNFFLMFSEAARVPEQVTSHVGEDKIVSEEVQEPLNQEGPFSEEEEVVLVSQSHIIEDEASAMVESTTSSAQEDAPKKSYASIVSAQVKVFWCLVFWI